MEILNGDACIHGGLVGDKLRQPAKIEIDSAFYSGAHYDGICELVRQLVRVSVPYIYAAIGFFG
jgi:hypothetical protein